MQTPLRILHLEDVEEDTVLVERELKKGNLRFEKKWVTNRSDFVDALANYNPDIILSDHSLPSFDSLAALDLTQKMTCDTPFVLVTSSLSEDFAVDIIKRGATDYILKERMQRLPAAVINAIEKRNMAKEKEKYFDELLAKTTLLNEAEGITGSGSWDWTPATNDVAWSDGMYRLLEYDKGEMQPSFEALFDRIDEKHRNAIAQAWKEALAAGRSFSEEFCLRNKAGQCLWFRGNWKPLKKEGLVMKWAGTLTNINDQKTVALQREQHAAELEKQVRQRTQELQGTNEKLARSNDNLRQFAYVASHDLKEPVRKIVTFTDMLKHNLQNAGQQALFYAGKIENAASRMGALIDGLLDYSTLDKTAAEQFVPTDLANVLAGVLTDLELVITQKGATMEIGKLPTLPALPLQMRQLFYNLVNNALKYTKEGVPPQVTVSSRTMRGEEKEEQGLPAHRNYCLLTITDNGIGFKPEEAEKIFEIFQRLHGKHEFSGTGLGLALCRKIVDIHHGKIFAASTPGEGASFFVVLPSGH